MVLQKKITAVFYLPYILLLSVLSLDPKCPTLYVNYVLLFQIIGNSIFIFIAVAAFRSNGRVILVAELNMWDNITWSEITSPLCYGF